jgi:hypothetical protein
MGINASPVDSDDAISVTISGLPSFETITAPSGDVITVKEQRSNNTYTITAVAPGQGVSGLALHSSYAGAGHPVDTLTATATNSTSGESATSASRTIAVTDPPSSSPPG